MKPFKINRNSWHYWVNKNLFQNSHMPYWEDNHRDFCSYWRATVFRVIFASFLSLLILVFAVILGAAVYKDPVGFALVIGSVTTIVAGSIGLFDLLIYLRDRHRRKASTEKPEGLLAQRYRAYKSRICPMVEYEK